MKPAVREGPSGGIPALGQNFARRHLPGQQPRIHRETSETLDLGDLK
jgi:hypothetical protein